MSSYQEKVFYIEKNGDVKAYPPDPNYHDVMDKVLIKHHKANPEKANIAACNKNIHLELGNECTIKNLTAFELCSRCFKG